MNLRFPAACGVSLLALYAAPAAAQEVVETGCDEMSCWAVAVDSEIVVEGRRAGTVALEDYAGSATLVDAAALEARVVRQLPDLSYGAPNVSLDPIGTFRGVANFSMRGLGVNSSIPSIEPTVGLFVDGVYIGVNAGTGFDMLDLKRVEILRGPQGVSFGRNTTGGAVLVTTADPEFAWSGHARAAIEGPVDEGRGRWRATGRAVVTGPLSESVAIRVGALHTSNPGYFSNLFDGKPFGAMETSVVRGGLAWRGPGVDVTAKLEWSESHGDGAAAHSNGLFARDTFEISVNQRGFYRSESLFGVVKAEVALGDGLLTNTMGFRDYDLATRNDIDSTPAPLFQSDTATAHRQWSNELTYSWDRASWGGIAGVYYLDQDVGYDESRDLSGFGAPPQFGGGRQGHRSLGLFAEGRFDLTDTLRLEAGLRWSHEEKDGAITYVRPRAECSAIAATCPTRGLRVAGENNGFTDSRTWTAFSPRVALAYAATPDLNFWASWARGHRSGGYNLRITQPAAFELVSTRLGSPAFDQERVDTFEIGGDWRLADETFGLRGAIFRSEVKGLQREVNVPSLSSGLAQSVYNTADARIEGLELELTARPVAGLQLGAHLGLLDADYTRVFYDLTGDGKIDGADLALDLPRAPDLTVGGSVSWRTGGFAADALFQHRARYAYTDNNWGWKAASERLDASVSYTFDRDAADITLRVFGRNLLDQVQFGGDTQLGFAGGPFSDGNNRPFDPRPGAGTFSPLLDGRTLGVEVGVEF